jgi:hypothetical protein
VNDTLLGWLIFLGTQVVGFSLMRPFYGIIRAGMIKHYAQLKFLYDNPVKEFEKQDQSAAVGFALIAGILWPLGLVLLIGFPLLRVWVGGSGIRSEWERDQELKAAQQKIVELERWHRAWRDE